ncbi:hypothetical protein FQN50_004949 [Emmonsiellopsis sp. PD_5]|nr:hypothetical protein FQN50_004949 [Emmonsiellopsis sp. PD_5]
MALPEHLSFASKLMQETFCRAPPEGPRPFDIEPNNLAREANLRSRTDQAQDCFYGKPFPRIDVASNFDKTQSKTKPEIRQQSRSVKLCPSVKLERALAEEIIGTLGGFTTENYWRFGKFISTNYQNAAVGFPTNFSKRPKKAKQRKHQINVQTQTARPVTISGPAKPRLITISEPLRRSPVVHENPESRHSLKASMVFDEKAREQNHHPPPECSPCIPSPSHDSGYMTQSPQSSFDDGSPLSHEEPILINSPRSFLHRLSLKNQIPIATRWLHKKSSLNRSVPSATRCSYSSPCTPLQPRFPMLSPAVQSDEKKALVAKCWSMGWILDHLEASIRNDSKPDLTLSSPVIIFVRSTTESAILDSIGDIFPGTSKEQLSRLCATLIAQVYLFSLQNHDHMGASPLVPNNPVDGIPEKPRTRLGIHISKTSQLQVKERLLQTRAADISARLDKFVEELLMDICGCSHDTLKRAIMVLVQLLEGKRNPESSTQ